MAHAEFLRNKARELRISKKLELTSFWAHELRIEQRAIALQRKSNSNALTGRTWRSRYGVLTVASNDTALRSRLEAWMHCLRAARV
jgi:hypothetical protein